MAIPLAECLNDLQNRIDEQQEHAHRQAWQRFLDGQITDQYFTPPARKPAPPKVSWPNIHINDALDDIDLMVLSEFGMVSAVLEKGGAECLNVRCNYGTGLVPSLFGCELFIMPRETETLPATRPCTALSQIKALIKTGPPDLKNSLGGKVFACGQRFLELLDQHPVLARNIELYHPDLQGPIDIAEMVWGSAIFYAFFDEPELLKALLRLCTDTYIRFMRQWRALAPAKSSYTTHWGLLLKGQLMLRNDSLMNLSPEIYTQFVRPLDQRLFDEFGGGAIHFCGRGDHFIAAMSATQGLTAVNLSQPHLNDMETIYRHTVDKGIKLLGLARETALAANRPLRGQVHCWP